MNPNERVQGTGLRFLSGPILVPIDGTEVSEVILPWVSRIAGASGCPPKLKAKVESTFVARCEPEPGCPTVSLSRNRRAVLPYH